MKNKSAKRSLVFSMVATALLSGCNLTPKPLTTISANDPEMKALNENRAKYSEKKVALIKKALPLSPTENDAFWREYYSYDAELKKLYDARILIIKDYAENYDKMNDDIADNLARRSLKIRDDRNDLFRKYYERIKKATSAIVAGQFLQIENEISILDDLKISTETPILPREISPATALKK